MVAALFTAGGCAGSDDGGSGSGGQGGTTSGAEPAAGAPRYDKTTVDDDVCKIFTKSDFSTFNMITGKVETSDFKPESAPIGVSCNFGLDDVISVGLLPTEAAAAALFATIRDGARNEVTADVVPDATESYFGATSTEEGEYYALARRGKLLVSVNLDPKINKMSADEAKQAAVGLTKIVFDRAPNLG
jgi:hypothetical protein